MTHLTDEQLRDWQIAGGGGDVVAHLAECDACSARLAAIVRDEPVANEASAPNEDEYVERGYRVFAPARRRLWRGISIATAAAAAAVLWMFWDPAWITGSHIEPVHPHPGLVTRGADIRGLAPIGPATLPLTFSWTSPVQAASFRVDVAEDSTTILSAAASGNTFTLGADAARQLDADHVYRWRVVALAADGETLAASDWTSFRLTR